MDSDLYKRFQHFFRVSFDRCHLYSLNLFPAAGRLTHFFRVSYKGCHVFSLIYMHSFINLYDLTSPGPEVIKLFSSSAQLSMIFQLLINVEIVKNCGKSRFKTQKQV